MEFESLGGNICQLGELSGEYAVQGKVLDQRELEESFVVPAFR